MILSGTRTGSRCDPVMSPKKLIPALHAHPHTDRACLTRRSSARRCGGTERGQQEGVRDARSPWGNRRPDRVIRLSVEQPTWLSGGAGTLKTLWRGGDEPLFSYPIHCGASSPRFCIDLRTATRVPRAGRRAPLEVVRRPAESCWCVATPPAESRTLVLSRSDSALGGAGRKARNTSVHGGRLPGGQSPCTNKKQRHAQTQKGPPFGSPSRFMMWPSFRPLRL